VHEPLQAAGLRARLGRSDIIRRVVCLIGAVLDPAFWPARIATRAARAFDRRYATDTLRPLPVAAMRGVPGALARHAVLRPALQRPRVVRLPSGDGGGGCGEHSRAQRRVVVGPLISMTHPDHRVLMRCPDVVRSLALIALAGACSFVLGTTAVSATTLVVLVSDRAIVIGADSMRTLAAGGSEAVCKVQHRDGVIYGFAGAVGSEQFDAGAIAAQELAGGGTLAQKGRRIADALQAGLVLHFSTRPVEAMRRELLDRHRGRPMTGFVAGLVEGRPRGFLVMVRAEEASGGVTLTTRVEPLDTTGPDRAVFLSTQHPDVIEQANGGLRNGRAAVGDLVAAARRLVDRDLQLEAQRKVTQRKSGPPVVVAVLDRDGFRLAVPGVCGPPPRER
jgi:hypothetical protein